MKIAIFYHLNFGGAKRVVMEHAKGLKQKGHEVDLYTINLEKDTFDPSPYCDTVYNYQFQLHTRFPFLKRLVNDYANFFLLKNLHQKIAKDIDSRQYDLVLAHPDKLTQAPFLLQFLRTKSVYYCQEPLRIVYEYSMRFKEKVGFHKYLYEAITRWYRKIIDRKNVRSATLTIASCFAIRERMIEAYEVYPKVVYCAVDHTIFTRMRNIKKKNVVFYVGSPRVWEDGYDLAQNAINLIPKKLRPQLHVVSWTKNNGERLSEKELVKIYNESLVTFCTSRLETFGLVPLESMACGTPVIATKVAGHRETVVDGKTGFHVDFDPRDIAEKLLVLLQNNKKAQDMGVAARKYVETQWRWDIAIQELENILKSV